MNKSELREALACARYAYVDVGVCARGLSALHRAARRQASRDAILSMARDLGITRHADFIICEVAA